jgi:hypothetical protein
MSPLIESDPGKQLHEVGISLSPEEAVELRQALDYWAEHDPADPDWHTHIGGAGEAEVTIGIGPRPPDVSQQS